MLYGHSETPQQRIDHLRQLRELQDRTGGFNAFIPLKFRRENNRMYELGERCQSLKICVTMHCHASSLTTSLTSKPTGLPSEETLPLMSLTFGADDLDGTIDDTTRIYSMAGAEDHKPGLSTTEIVSMIRSAGYRPVERDTLYRTVREW